MFYSESLSAPTSHSFVSRVKSGLASFFRGLDRTLSRSAYVRAAAELSRMGYHEAAANCIEEMKKL